MHVLRLEGSQLRQHLRLGNSDRLHIEHEGGCQSQQER